MTTSRLLLLVLATGALACAVDPGAGLALESPASAACRACHAREAEEARADFAHRSHPEGCRACHGAHAEGDGLGPAGLARACEDCHATERAEFALPFAHPLGPTTGCVDCHAPHGVPRRERNEELREEACLRCHREFDGPFLFEHEGDRNFRCLSCHAAHGSANRRLLLYAEARLLCLSCHSFLSDEHAQSIGSDFRECLRCHTEVHGSYWDRHLLR